MKKVLSLFLAFAFVIGIFVSAPITITANAASTNEEKIVKSISAVPTKALEEFTDGYIQQEYIDVDMDSVLVNYYYYNPVVTDPEIKVVFTDGTSITGNYGYIEQKTDLVVCFDDMEQSYENQLTVGTYKTTLYLKSERYADEYKVKCDYTFEIVKNPVKSFDVTITRTLISSEADGECSHAYYENNEYKVFKHKSYNFSSVAMITVNFVDGTSLTGTVDEIYKKTGESVVFSHEPKNFVVGENNAKAKYRGKECDFKFIIEDNPIKSITIKPTKKHIENITCVQKKETILDENGKQKTVSYPYYDLKFLKPIVTVEYYNGDVIKGTKEEIESELMEDEDVIVFALKQDYNNQLSAGKHTVKASVFGNECEFLIEITPMENSFKKTIQSEMKSIKATINKSMYENDDDFNSDLLFKTLKANRTGNVTEITNVNEWTYERWLLVVNDWLYSKRDKLFHWRMGGKSLLLNNIIKDELYNIDFSQMTVTKIVESSKKIDSVEVLYEFYFKNDGILYCAYFGKVNNAPKLLDIKVENYYIKSISVVPERKLMTKLDTAVLESISSDFNEFYYDDKTQYFKLDNLTYTLKITYNNGKIKTIKNAKPGIVNSFKFIIRDNQSYENQFKKGKNKVTAEYMGRKCTFNVEVIDCPYTAVSISGENNLKVNLRKKDGTIQTMTAIYFDPENMFYHYNLPKECAYGTLYTDKGVINNFVIFIERSNDRKKIVKMSAGIYGMKTDTLKSNKWANYISTDFNPAFNYCAEYSSGYDKLLRKHKFINFNGKITESNLDDIIILAVNSSLDKDLYETKFDANGNRYISVPVSECKTIVSKMFNIKNVDLKKSDNYNAKTKEIKVYLYPCRLDSDCIKNKKVVFKNNKYVFTAEYIVDETNVNYTVPIKIVYNANFQVLSIRYGEEPVVNTKSVSQGVKLQWKKVNKSSSYIIYRRTYNPSTKKYSAWETINASYKGTSYTDTTVKLGVSYSYAVRAVVAGVKSNFTATAPMTYNVAPTVKIANASKGVKVTWNKITGATGYKVYRSEYVNGKWTGWKSVKTITKGSTVSWTDTKVKSGVKYKYTVKAVNGKTASIHKSSSSLLCLAQPTVTVKTVSNGVKVTWTQITGATSYKIYRSEYDTKTKKWGGWKAIKTAKSTSKSYIDKLANKGVKYKYTVKAVNGKVASTYKASVSVKR